MKIWCFYTEIWRYINFQNGGRPPSWNCFTNIRHHPRSLSCWPQLSVKFHVNRIHRSEYSNFWIWSYLNFAHIWLAMPIHAGPQNGGFGSLWTPRCDYSPLTSPKGTSLRKSASVKLSTVNIRWSVWPVGELTESVTDTHTHTHTQGKVIFNKSTENAKR